ncbi:hypothetical protein M5F04_04410 [Acinetobacter sp. ANC 7200]|uniref:hypothetical protein n=1 Tax=Acinetobacter amyesii TaxID=2942470 RepID=UPI0020BFD15C|nr:hypothetical protein [Acinetobacter amyesii]MCL6243815.1 hypothetical protein [Acinetobacter amyesii]
MKEKVKKLYFTNDFSVENVQKLQGDGWIIRNAQLAKSDSFVEQADEYGGDVPERYKIGVGKITVQLSAETSSELQQTIDDAKAECEKVVAENAELKDKLLIAEKALVAADEEIKALKAAAKKPTAAELKAAKTAEEASKVEQSKE